MNRVVTVQPKNVYGVEKIYPACRNADLLAKLRGTKTLSVEDLTVIRELGFEVQMLMPGSIAVFKAAA